MSSNSEGKTARHFSREAEQTKVLSLPTCKRIIITLDKIFSTLEFSNQIASLQHVLLFHFRNNKIEGTPHRCIGQCLSVLHFLTLRVILVRSRFEAQRWFRFLQISKHCQTTRSNQSIKVALAVQWLRIAAPRQSYHTPWSCPHNPEYYWHL